MARKEDRGTKYDNVVRFDFRHKLKKQHDTRRAQGVDVGPSRVLDRIRRRDAGIELAYVRSDLNRLVRTRA